MHAARLFLAACAAVACTACFLDITVSDGSRDAEVSEAFSYRLDASTVLRITLEGVNGVVTVAVDPESDSAQVAGERIVRSDTYADALQFMDQVTVQVEELEGELVVRTAQPSGTEGREVIVDYDLTIPPGIAIDIANVNGAVTVHDGVGDVEVTLVNGEIECDVAPTPGGLIDLTVVNGTITLDVPRSASAIVEADVVNGSINVIGLMILDATTSDRSVRGRLGVGDGLIDLNATNGTITLRGS